MRLHMPVGRASCLGQPPEGVADAAKDHAGIGFIIDCQVHGDSPQELSRLGATNHAENLGYWICPAMSDSSDVTGCGVCSRGVPLATIPCILLGTCQQHASILMGKWGSQPDVAYRLCKFWLLPVVRVGICRAEKERWVASRCFADGD